MARTSAMTGRQIGRTYMTSLRRRNAVAVASASATSSGAAVRHAGRSIPSVMRLRTKPGLTVTTCTPDAASRLRRPDRNAVSPALAEP